MSRQKTKKSLLKNKELKKIIFYILSLQKKEEELAKKNYDFKQKRKYFSRKKTIGKNNESE